MSNLNKPKMSVSYENTKDEGKLDLLDQELIRLFVSRYKLCLTLTAKSSSLNEESKKFRIEQRAQWAHDFGLDYELFFQIYNLLEQ